MRIFKVISLKKIINNNSIGFRVKDAKGEIWEIRNCQMKDVSKMPFISYYGALAVTKRGFNEGHPVHLNQIRKNEWELLINEPNE